MRNSIKVAVVCIVGVIFLTSCNIPGITKQDETTDDFFVYNSSVSESSNEEQDDFSWLREPSVKATNIITPDVSQVNTNDDFDRAFLNCSIIFNNGKYGFIDYDGDIIVEPSYDNYYICNCGRMILYDKQDGEISKSCTLNENGTIENGVTFHESDDTEYYWDDTNKKIYYKAQSESFTKEYNGDNTVVAMNANVISIGDNRYSVPANSNRFYALIKDKEPVTNFDYEDYYAPNYRKIKSTAVAFKKNGKWGYLNQDGDEIVPFICSDVFSSFNGNLTEEDPHPYLFSYGYVPVCIDSKYYYYDLEGNKVSSTIDFEQARPVINGRAWVKEDGKWGVIQLGEIKDYGNVTATTTTRKYSTYPKYTHSYKKSTSKTTLIKEKTTSDKKTSAPITTKKLDTVKEKTKTTKKEIKTTIKSTEKTTTNITSVQTKD